MKVVWEASDIYAGLRTKLPGTTITGDHIVGYCPGTRDPKRKYCLVSLADGMVIGGYWTKERVAQHLNANGDVPVELVEPMKIAARHNGG